MGLADKKYSKQVKTEWLVMLVIKELAHNCFLPNNESDFYNEELSTIFCLV